MCIWAQPLMGSATPGPPCGKPPGAGIMGKTHNYAPTRHAARVRYTQIANDVAAGMTIAEAMAKYDLCNWIIRRACRARNVKPRQPSGDKHAGTRTHPNPRHAAMLEMIRSGESQTGVARHFGVSQTAVWHVCQRWPDYIYKSTNQGYDEHHD